jgi:hypothetical protein
VPLVPGAPLTKDQDIELAFWASVKDSKTPAVLRTYLERYPSGEFALIARALIEHYERQLKAEIAEREEAKKRQEEERIAAAVKRIEEERRAREAALAEERKRAEEAKNAAEAKAVEEKQRAEWLAKTEELRKLAEEARLTREALATAEKQRLQAVKDAEDAKKAAEHAIELKREAEKSGNATKLAALPKLETPPTGGPFDGAWVITRTGTGCDEPTNTFAVVITGGDIHGRGKVTPDGAFKFQGKNNKGKPRPFTGTLRGSSGSGTFYTVGGRCKGTFTAQRK